MKAGVIGATGYAGAELVRILAGHPEIDGLILSSVSFEGEHFEDVYPNMLERICAPLVKAEEVISAAGIVFAALPHGVGEPYAKACVEKGIPFIDLSADFRFGDDEITFNAWYGKSYQYPELHKNAVYGLPELNRNRIRELAAGGAAIIGNPGCYPTGASLGVFPALAKGLAAASATIIIDSVSGISGGGREPSRSFHYPECADSVTPYKIDSHRHRPEIMRNFAAMTAAAAPEIIFTPHLAPMNRGILSTMYIPLAAPARDHAATIHALYTDFYHAEPFVRVLPLGAIAATNRVRQSNYCDISIHFDHRESTLIVVTAIDNMVKGAAGQAVQNMNIICGFNERAGLEMIPALF
ncbi:MAG: N-acetyl-gamma-glutamyl-phosphate reductase [Treponema sp.]|jgi:N-acetyl-gamma-glutamyl-phosphate reductase|nr:N-acetyl-gamma-glutamyl-phosphate reductase [Treponema sp.]